MSRLKESYWLFGKEAVEFALENSDETKQKVDYKFISAMIFDKMEYDIYMFEPTYPWDVDGILSIATRWESYLEIDEELYAWLCHEEEEWKVIENSKAINLKLNRWDNEFKTKR